MDAALAVAKECAAAEPMDPPPPVMRMDFPAIESLIAALVGEIAGYEVVCQVGVKDGRGGGGMVTGGL